MFLYIGNILNIYSDVRVTASDQKEAFGSVWKPIDGVISLAVEASWISLKSSRSWWRMELPRRTAISRVHIFVPFFSGKNRVANIIAMSGLAVYIGDSSVGNGSKNAMCGKPWVPSYTSVLSIDCTDTLVGKYLFVAAADRPGAALYMTELTIYGCEGESICLCFNLFQFCA